MSQDQYRNSEEQFFSLKGQLAAGRITQQQFDAALKQLMIQDAQGRYWMIGADTGKWYVHDGQTWVEANPSVASAPPAPESYATAQAQTRGSNPMFWLALGGILVVCLLGVIGLGIAFSQGGLQISMNKATNTPFPTLTPIIIVISPNIPTAALPTPIPPIATPQPSSTSIPLTATPQPSQTTPASRITFKFDVGVTQPERDEIQKGMALVTQRLGDVGPLQVYASDNMETMLTESNTYYQRSANSPETKNIRQHFTDGSWGAYFEKDAFWIRIGKTWRAAAPQYRLRLMAHEYFHGAQAFLSKKTFADQAPLWLTEGSAEYEASVLASESGLIDLARMRQQKADRARGVLNLLNTMETLKGAEAEDTETPYTIGYLAADYLASSYGNQNVLTKYWQARATASTWQDAFKTAFGVTPTDFYAKFEDYRRAQFAPYCGTVGETITNTLAVTYIRQFAPGAMSFDYWPQPAPSDSLAYVFCVKGYPLATTTFTVVNQVLKYPKDATLDSCGGACWILYISPSSPAGTLIFAADLPDGQHGQASFQHPSGVAVLASPTPIPPTAIPIPPGLYVTRVRLEPPNPNPNQEVGFYVTFLNTASGTQNYRWIVYIYKADNLKNSSGETSSQVTSIPIGTVEQKALGVWKTGIGTCGNYIARVAWLDDNKKATPFNKPDGQTYDLPFSVCQ